MLNKRRDFLKLLSLVPASVVLSPLSKIVGEPVKNANHIIILVFDAWSAENVQMFGYPRRTMPNLEKFSEKAIVYHRNYSGGNFTIPGTASILTGLYPWTHRAFALGGVISKEHSKHTVFNVLNPSYKTIGFSQNVNSDTLIFEAGKDVEKHIPFGSYDLNDRITYDASIFQNDAYSAFLAFENTIFNHEKGRDGSLFGGPMIRLLDLENEKRLLQKYGAAYGGNLPNNYEMFALPNLVDGFIKLLSELTEPSLIYFHVYPPHKPNFPYPKYLNKFNVDNYKPIAKPDHPLVIGPKTYGLQNDARLHYDAFLASWDEETGRLFEYFETSGIKQNSTIIITSDHGELHERGYYGHTTPIHYEPLVHVPLIISTPGLDKRVDVHEPTSNIDLLPTIAKIANIPQPAWVEGQVLPIFETDTDPLRSVFTFDASQNSSFSALKIYTIALIKGNRKLIKFVWPKYTKLEYYDLSTDPEEMNNLVDKKPSDLSQMEEEIYTVIENANKAYNK